MRPVSLNAAALCVLAAILAAAPPAAAARSLAAPQRFPWPPGPWPPGPFPPGPPAPAPPSPAPPPAPPAGPECMWREYHRSEIVSAWEFQLAPHRHMVRDRSKALRNAEALLRRISSNSTHGVQFVEQSRWMTIYEEKSYQVTTWHGGPLRPERSHKKHPFPWRGVGYLRLRSYKLTTPAGAYVPSAMQGTADLTFKMKKVDPVIGAGPLILMPEAAGAKLTKKVENDVHCNHTRDTMSPLYRPVSQYLNITTPAGVKAYFPNLAQVCLLDEDDPLQYMHTVWRSKAVWTVVFAGVVGEANLVIKYNTSFEDAVAGRSPKNGEFSLRIRREATGPESEAAMWRALDALAGAAQAFRDEGWDEKTAAWDPNPGPSPSPAPPEPTPSPEPSPTPDPSPAPTPAPEPAPGSDPGDGPGDDSGDEPEYGSGDDVDGDSADDSSDDVAGGDADGDAGDGMDGAAQDLQGAEQAPADAEGQDARGPRQERRFASMRASLRAVWAGHEMADARGRVAAT